jgi:alkanesulfonate monooxygenase SsuD/methylene tetrahydromethanopterin reductase-like flavin-dependent oxidoreductase (luciferase family)
MIECSIFHNGAYDLPAQQLASGMSLYRGTLLDSHEAAKRSLVNQVRQGILADRLGYDAFYMSEHHFNTEGPEFSPNPLVVEAAIACQTSRIRLGQAANILTWWHPIRLAEQVAMVDVLSGGRVECGLGRGFQPRESEVFGWPYGSTQQDQERNRAYFAEAYELLIKAWTQPSFSHHGEFFSIPPSFTKWHNRQTIAQFGQSGFGPPLDEVLQLGEPDDYSAGNPVEGATTILKQLSVYPQPVQKPHPQLWMPVFSGRTADFIARHGLNGYALAAPTPMVKGMATRYLAAAESAGWPDYRDRGAFKFGWDGEKRRGVAPLRWVHVEDGGVGNVRRFLEGLEVAWDYYGAFGFAALLTDDGSDAKITGELLTKRGIAIVGSKQEVIEKIVQLRDELGSEDLNMLHNFEGIGLRGEEVEEQMQLFAEECMPVLRREMGGGPELSAPGIDFSATGVAV